MTTMLQVYIGAFSALRVPFALGLGMSLALLLALSPNRLEAHGSVAFEDDRCLINIDFMQAHFTVFQPETEGNEEFCENIPGVTRSVFVMEYLHNLLSEMEIDFRIVRDVNNVGRYATWEDIEAIEDLNAATVFYQAPRIEEGGFFRTSHDFTERGTYIGVVTATHPTEDRNYNAVFYFRVGGRPLGTIPIFAGLLVLLQLGYWVSSGGYKRWSQKRAEQKARRLKV